MALVVPETGNDLDDRLSLKRLNSMVRRRCDSALNDADKEDVVSDILTAACTTTARRGTAGMEMDVAVGYSRKGSYYRRSAQHTKQRLATLSQHSEDGACDPLFATGSARDDYRDCDVRSVLKCLPRNEATVLWRCDGQGYTLAQVGAAMGVSIATIDRTLKRARLAFRQAWAA